jgi:hypothetical protein
MNPPYRARIAGLANLPAITLNGTEYTGPYLSTMLSVNPEHPADEAQRTPQLIGEFARLVAFAWRAKEMTLIDYKVWRDGLIFKYTTDEAHADSVGLLSKTAKGDPKLPSKDAAERYLRTLPEYLRLKTATLEAEEVWSTLYGAFEAAKARTYMIFDAQGSGTVSTRSSRGPATDDGTGSTYEGSRYDEAPTRPERVVDQERDAVQAPRTPLPPPPPVIPPPPSRSE